jgi:hypothetical protein
MQLKFLFAAVCSSVFIYALAQNSVKFQRQQNSSTAVFSQTNNIDVGDLTPIKESPTKDAPNTIQLAILLDVSGSMEGLINQAKSELWAVVNEIAKAKRNGQAPKLEIALYNYGTPQNPSKEGYVRQILDFTSNLDKVSEKLFSLSISGGDEYCGTVIEKSVKELAWSNNPNEYRVIFIAGNEPFTQGPIDYKVSCSNATKKDIVVNTIHCENQMTGIETMWQDGARVGAGNYFWINSNLVEEDIPTPYDSLLEKLNYRGNGTYWGYGSGADFNVENITQQDKNNSSLNKKGYYNRIKAKSSKNAYSNQTQDWDITSRFDNDSTALVKIKDQELPDTLKGKSIDEKKQILRANLAQRDSINKEIGRLSLLRDQYIVEAKRRAPTNEKKEKTLGEAIAEALHEQAGRKGYGFE